MTSNEPDLKALFRNALDAEPPLRIDTAGLVRAGRRRARVRRMAMMGGVVGAVVAVVVGTATIASFGQAARQVTPASPSSTSRTTSAPPSSSQQSSPTPSYANVPSNDAHARELSVVLGQGMPAPAGMQALPSPGFNSAFDFVNKPGRYTAVGELKDVQGTGKLSVEVAYGKPGSPNLTCLDVSQSSGPWDNCNAASMDGMPVVMTARTRGSAIVWQLATRRSDGSRVTAVSENTSDNPSSPGPVQRPFPPMDFGALNRIVNLPGLTY
ncbi:hypothetical protein F0L68_20650 [Solihabitans fulvus]|uniref:Uncharacterized protein n=1 Tax=Solihabitans fulvus TaxID=1892852 RepID=A0A5B2XAA9_9PSEU|nr:hypothetical protein [Solihabitans fulvus]KAA2260136.1 hypothetical protein F0L68_20650 [Solihabitans fulvus]